MYFIYLVAEVKASHQERLDFLRSNNANTKYLLGKTLFETYFTKYKLWTEWKLMNTEKKSSSSKPE